MGFGKGRERNKACNKILAISTNQASLRGVAELGVWEDGKEGKDLTGFENIGSLDSYQHKLTSCAQQAENTVTIEIEDNGPGISDELKDKIIQPFLTTKRGTHGTGLGLSITNDIVKAHGAEIDIESVESEKTRFIINIPRG